MPPRAQGPCKPWVALRWRTLREQMGGQEQKAKETVRSADKAARREWRMQVIHRGRRKTPGLAIERAGKICCILCTSSILGLT
eukprot:415512-Pyramimonas_sp.AAC.1